MSDTSYLTIIDRIKTQIAVNSLQLKDEKYDISEQYVLFGQNSALRWVLEIYDSSPTTNMEENK